MALARLRWEHPIAVGSGPLLGWEAFSGDEKRPHVWKCGRNLITSECFLRLLQPIWRPILFPLSLWINSPYLWQEATIDWTSLPRRSAPQRRDSIHPRRPITVHSHLADTSSDHKKNWEREEDFVVISVLKLLKEEQFKQENWGGIAERTQFLHLMLSGGRFALFK